MRAGSRVARVIGAGVILTQGTLQRTGRCASVTDFRRICALGAPRHPPRRARNPVPIYFQNTLLRNERRSTVRIPIRSRDCRICRPRQGWDVAVARKARLRFFRGADAGCIQLSPVGSIPSRTTESRAGLRRPFGTHGPFTDGDPNAEALGYSRMSLRDKAPFFLFFSGAAGGEFGPNGRPPGQCGLANHRRPGRGRRLGRPRCRFVRARSGRRSHAPEPGRTGPGHASRTGQD
jgi:hypothetical protein